MSAWTAAIHNSFCMFLTVRQWSYHCVQWQIDSVGVFVWAPAPFFVCFVLFFCCCFAFSAGETQVWLGDLRVVFFVFVGCGFVVFIDLPTPRTLCPCTVYIFSLLSCKDRVLARHRPRSREKKSLRQHMYGSTSEDNFTETKVFCMLLSSANTAKKVAG